MDIQVKNVIVIIKKMLKQLIKNIYWYMYGEELVKDCKIYVPEPPAKSNREKLHELALSFQGTDPTPKDEVSDEVSCVFSLTTILSKLVPFPILSYTPKLLEYLQSDKRFRTTNEFREGNIILSVTTTGNGSVMGHTGICTKGGKILSNASSSGLWDNKFDNLSWIERYSRKGGLSLHIFELL